MALHAQQRACLTAVPDALAQHAGLLHVGAWRHRMAPHDARASAAGALSKAVPASVLVPVPAGMPWWS